MMLNRPAILLFIITTLLISCAEDISIESHSENVLIYKDLDLTKGVMSYLSSSEIEEIGRADLEEVDQLLIHGLERKTNLKNVTIEIPDGSVDALQDAVDQAEEGDEILIKSGTHTESSTVIITKRITIRSEADAEIVFDVPPVETAGIIEPAIYIVGVDRVHLDGVQLTSSSSYGGTGILLEESEKTVLMNNEFTNFQFSIMVEDGNRTRILRNTINNTTDWLSNPDYNAFGITIVNGNQSLIIGNEIRDGFFGAWLSDFRGFYFGNDMQGNLFGSIFCNVPANSFPLPSGKVIGSNQPAKKWFALFNNTENNLATGILVIDGARDCYFSSNSFANNAAYDIELVGTSERFGFTTPPSVDNWVRASSDMIVKDCGDGNRVDGVSLVDTDEDPCN